MSEEGIMLYRKHGRRYFPAGWHMTLMAPGIWIVHGRPGVKCHRYIAPPERVHDMPALLQRAALERHRDAIANTLVNYRFERAMSANHLSGLIIDEMMREMAKEVQNL